MINNEVKLASELEPSVEVCVEASLPSPVQGDTATTNNKTTHYLTSS